MTKTNAIVHIGDIEGETLRIIGRVRKAIKLSNNPDCLSKFTEEALNGDIVKICEKYVTLV